ncbi:MAG: hypothetical protein V2G42_09240 [bacterium JZ-2024 1]
MEPLHDSLGHAKDRIFALLYGVMAVLEGHNISRSVSEKFEIQRYFFRDRICAIKSIKQNLLRRGRRLALLNPPSLSFQNLRTDQASRFLQAIGGNAWRCGKIYIPLRWDPTLSPGAFAGPATQALRGLNPHNICAG